MEMRTRTIDRTSESDGLEPQWQGLTLLLYEGSFLGRFQRVYELGCDAGGEQIERKQEYDAPFQMVSIMYTVLGSCRTSFTDAMSYHVL